MRSLARPDGFAWAGLSVAVYESDRVTKTLTSLLEQARKAGVSPTYWRLGRDVALALRRPTQVLGLPATYEGHGWQMALETDPPVDIVVVEA